MGVTHGNDQATFEKARFGGKNGPIYLDFPPATMMELTNYVKVAPSVLESLDEGYGD